MVTPLMLSVAAAGAAAMLSGAWLDRMNRRAAAWPSIEAEVTRSQRLADPLAVQSTVEFRYRFTVNERCFESSRVSFAVDWPPDTRLQRIVARCPVGIRLTVWYDPGDPSIAVIERPGRSGGLGLALAGSLLMAWSILLA